MYALYVWREIGERVATEIVREMCFYVAPRDETKREVETVLAIAIVDSGVEANVAPCRSKGLDVGHASYELVVAIGRIVEFYANFWR